MRFKFNRLSITFALISVGIGLTAAQPAAQAAPITHAAPSATVIVKGQICIPNSNNAYYCMNNYEGKETVGNKIQMWQQYEYQNNWLESKVGTVRSGWPWTGLSGDELDNSLKGNNVFQIKYVGGDTSGVTNWCATQLTYDNTTSTGSLVLGVCSSSNPTSQLFVDGNGFGLVYGVWTTQSAYNDGNAYAQVLATGGLDNGQVVVTAVAGTAYASWKWLDLYTG
jgi:hypothetical protein